MASIQYLIVFHSAANEIINSYFDFLQGIRRKLKSTLCKTVNAVVSSINMVKIFMGMGLTFQVSSGKSSGHSRIKGR